MDRWSGDLDRPIEIREEGKIVSEGRGISWKKITTVLVCYNKKHLVKHRERFSIDIREVWEWLISNFNIKTITNLGKILERKSYHFTIFY